MFCQQLLPWHSKAPNLTWLLKSIWNSRCFCCFDFFGGVLEFHIINFQIEFFIFCNKGVVWDVWIQNYSHILQEVLRFVFLFQYVTITFVLWLICIKCEVFIWCFIYLPWFGKVMSLKVGCLKFFCSKTVHAKCNRNYNYMCSN